ncbi:MAG: GNAT family N-acetyltransferase [Candidatus Micrarchaeota archaeon]|nr:GNAT family N-acetyltransferase [Candidatus Micrarchaeota archaeon]
MAPTRVSLVRAKEANDFEAVLRIQKACKNKTYAAYVEENDLRYLFRNGTISLVKADGEVAGLVAFLPDKEDRNLVEHTNLAILPRYAGNGIGLAAFDLDLKIMKDRGFKYAWGVVHPGNIGSLSIVRKSDFECVGRAGNFYGDGEPRLIFEKRL